MKKILCVCLAALCCGFILPGCARQAAEFDASRQIAVVTREDGSGTRGAFVELFSLSTAREDGEIYDETTTDAIVTNSTAVMMTMVSNSTYTLGYISLGSLNQTVKPLAVDGVLPTAENIHSGDYTVLRPFHVATTGELSPVTQDFISYILSAEGQAVVEQAGYIASQQNPAPFVATGASGKIVVSGSSSVSPVMEKLKEAYLAVNFKAEIEIQQSDSTTGMQSLVDGICDIGMASRELKESELAQGLQKTVIALDGIVIITNNGNPLDSISNEQVCAVWSGETTTWQQLLDNGQGGAQ